MLRFLKQGFLQMSNLYRVSRGNDYCCKILLTFIEECIITIKQICYTKNRKAEGVIE